MSNLENIVNQVRQATDYHTNKRILKEKIQADLHVPYNGGLFKITPDLFSFVVAWGEEEMFLEDVYQNPIKINRLEFLALCKQHYQMVMNEWHIQHENLKRIRKV